LDGVECDDDDEVIFKLFLDDVLDFKLHNQILCHDHSSLPNSTPQL